MVSSLVKRLTISAVLVPLSILTIFKAPAWVFFLVVECFVLIALYEFLKLAEKKKMEINLVLGLFFGALMPFSVYFSNESVVLATASVSLFIFNFHRRLREQALLSTAVTVFGIIYVAWFFSFFIKIRHLEHGAYWAFYTLLLVKGGDAGAYFIGRKYGRVKLIEHISPNKSVEGAWAGLVTTVLLSLISKTYLPHVPMYHLFFLGLAAGILSQVGDLAESLIKRDVGVKDSGEVPGLGGFLDVLDSLILTVPFVYCYLVTAKL
jgi:phosphatidate cytidylyltransferase